MEAIGNEMTHDDDMNDEMDFHVACGEVMAELELASEALVAYREGKTDLAHLLEAADSLHDEVIRVVSLAQYLYGRAAEAGVRRLAWTPGRTRFVEAS